MNKSSDNQDTDNSSPVDLELLPDGPAKKLVSDLIERHRYHTKLAKDLNRRYKTWGPFLLIFIPVILHYSLSSRPE